MTNNKPKITTVDKVFMFILVGIADGVDFLGSLAIAIPVIGPAMPIVTGLFGAIISAIMIFWLYNKEVSTKWFWGGSGIELIPFVNALPFRTGALIMTIIEDEVPAVKQVTSITKPASKMPTPAK